MIDPRLVMPSRAYRHSFRLFENRHGVFKFTPQKADSRWSTINRKSYAALKATGRSCLIKFHLVLPKLPYLAHNWHKRPVAFSGFKNEVKNAHAEKLLVQGFPEATTAPERRRTL